MKSLSLIAVEDVQSRGLRRGAERIAELAYVDLVSGQGKWGYTFWLTAGGRVAGMRSYRHP